VISTKFFRRSNNLFGACFIVFTEAEDDWLGTESERLSRMERNSALGLPSPDSDASGFYVEAKECFVEHCAHAIGASRNEQTNC
jgi:hypothetical protein